MQYLRGVPHIPLLANFPLKKEEIWKHSTNEESKEKEAVNDRVASLPYTCTTRPVMYTKIEYSHFIALGINLSTFTPLQ